MLDEWERGNVEFLFQDERPLGDGLYELGGRTVRDIPLSDLFVDLLSGSLRPMAELLDLVLATKS